MQRRGRPRPGFAQFFCREQGACSQRGDPCLTALATETREEWRADGDVVWAHAWHKTSHEGRQTWTEPVYRVTVPWTAASELQDQYLVQANVSCERLFTSATAARAWMACNNAMGTVGRNRDQWQRSAAIVHSCTKISVSGGRSAGSCPLPRA